MELIDIDLLLIVATVSLFFLYYWLNRDFRVLPPSPVRPLPIVGHMFELNSDLRAKFKEWRIKCGDIFSLRIGSKFMIIINGYDLIKEVFVQNADDFSDRPFTVLDLASGFHHYGIITSSGKVWKEQRAVGLQILRNFGLGKNLLADKIQNEVSYYIDHLSDHTEQPIDISMITNMSTSNIICSIMFGHRFEYSDQSFRKLMTEVSVFASNFNINSSVIFIPALRHLPGDFFRNKDTERGVKEMFQLFDECIEKCRNGEYPDCLISEYLKEERKRRQSGIATSLDENHLKRILFDLFLAGTDTTSTTIYWFILYMIHHADIQKKIFDEINENIGTGRVPNIHDKDNLTYLNAAIMETQRIASIAPNSLAHTCPRDVIIRGYTIPKGAYVMPCLDSVLHDEKIWGHDVLSFRPERFIDQAGKILNPEEFIPFSIGKRICAGKSMANAELYLYLSNMLQKFEFQPVDPLRPPTLKYIFGQSVYPTKYQVKIVSRFR